MDEGIYVATIFDPIVSGRPYTEGLSIELLVLAGLDKWDVNNAAVDESLQLMDVFPNAPIDFELDWVGADAFLEHYTTGRPYRDRQIIERIVDGAVVSL